MDLDYLKASCLSSTFSEVSKILLVLHFLKVNETLMQLLIIYDNNYVYQWLVVIALFGCVL